MFILHLDKHLVDISRLISAKPSTFRVVCFLSLFQCLCWQNRVFSGLSAVHNQMGNCYDRTKPGFLLFIDQFSQRPYKEETLHSAETLEPKNRKQVKIKHRDKTKKKTCFFTTFPSSCLTLFHPNFRKKSMSGNSDIFCIFLYVC